MDVSISDQTRSGGAVTLYSSTNGGGNSGWTFDGGCPSPFIWDGGAPDTNWTTPGNWSTNVVPGISDTATFNGTSVKNCSIAGQIIVGGLSVQAGYAGTITNGSPGLLGQYYDGVAFNTFMGAYVDAAVNFNPADTVLGNNRAGGGDTWSVRWTGQVLADFTETYTFFVDKDNGARLWVDNQLIVDQWLSATGEYSGALDLEAGRWYDVVLEFFENTGASRVVFQWSSPGTSKEIVPQSNLRSALPFTVGSAGFSQAAGIFQGGASTIDVNGPFSLSGGTFVSTSGRLEVSGAFTVSGCSFDAAGGLLLLNPSVAQALDLSAAPSLNHFTLNDGLAAYFKMDEAGGKVTDSSGYENDGTRVNGAALSTLVSAVPKFTNPGSTDFDGTDDYVSFTSTDATLITIAAWVYSDAQGESTFPRILEMPGCFLYFRRGGATANDNNVLSFTSDRATNGDWRTPDNSISDGQWYHVAVTYDSSSTANNPVLYINGVSQTVTEFLTPSGAQISTAGTGYIGNRSATDRSWDGRIDDFRIYSRILGAAEILRLAQGLQPATSVATVTLSGTLDVNGTLTLNAGTLNAAGNGVSVGASWRNHGGLFTPGAGTVTLDGSASGREIISGNTAASAPNAFNNLTLNASAASESVTLRDAFDAGTLTITSGALVQASWNVTAGPVSVAANGAWTNISAGDVTLKGDVSNAGVITFNGGGAG